MKLKLACAVALLMASTAAPAATLSDAIRAGTVEVRRIPSRWTFSAAS